MSSPSVAPCTVLTSQQMFQWLQKNLYAGCVSNATEASSPVCQAVLRAAAQPNADLKTLAKELHKIRESDLVNYFQGPGAAYAQQTYHNLLAYVKCLLAPRTKADQKTVKGEVDAVASIRNWYLDRFLLSFGKAQVPGVDFTEADARSIRRNVDQVSCRNADVYHWVLFWAILVGVVMLVVGWMVGHHRGKQACVARIGQMARGLRSSV